MSAIATLEFAMLRRFCNPETQTIERHRHQTTEYSKLDVHIGTVWREYVRGRVVLDYGSGFGNEMIQFARAGAAKVYGLETSENQLREARLRLAQSDYADVCRLVSQPPAELVDCVFSFDSFEHFEDPAAILDQMHSALKPGGKVYVSFGPTWFHPIGGHAFSAFPWAHVLLSEKAAGRLEKPALPWHFGGLQSEWSKSNDCRQLHQTL